MTLFDRIFTGSGASQLPMVSPVSWLIENNIVHDASTILQWWKHDASSKGLPKRRRDVTCYWNKNFQPEKEVSKEAIINSHRKRYFHFLGTKLKEDFSNVEFLLDRLTRYSRKRFVFRYLPWDGASDRFERESFSEFELLTFYVIKNGVDMDFNFPLAPASNDYSFPIPQGRHEWNPPDDSHLPRFHDFISNEYPAVASHLEVNLDDLVGRRLRQLSFVYSDSADFPPVLDTIFFPNYSASPQDEELLVGEMLAVSYARKLDGGKHQELKEEFLVYNSHFARLKERELADEVNRHATSAARAALFSRNFSHNIGSHSLSHPAFAQQLNIGEGTTAKVHSQRLHLYLQHRYDWISQMVSGDGASGGQPLRLLNEVMPALFQQRGLLGTLIEDQGFKPEAIRFTVEIGDQGTAVYTLGGGASADATEHLGAQINKEVYGTKIQMKDIFVGIPGGRVGSQALFSIIENVMRNSAKYAKRKDDGKTEMDIHLKIESTTETANAYKVTIWDAAAGSAKDDTPLAAQLKRVWELTNQDLIGNDGGLATKGRGLLDMKESARFLEGKLAPTDPLGCELASPNQGTLAHTFLLQRPLLLGLLDPGSDVEVGGCGFLLSAISAQQSEWREKRRPSIGVIWDDGTADMAATKAEIAQHHCALPYRLLVVCQNEARRDFWKIGSLPHNRLQVISPASAFWNGANCAVQYLLGTGGTGPSFCGCCGEEAAILLLYEAWLGTAKPAPDGKWKLGIGMERPKEHVLGAWEGAAKFESQLAELWVYSKSGGTFELATAPTSQSAGDPWPSVRAAAATPGFFISPAWKSWLLFDNHGNCFKPSSTKSLVSLKHHEMPGFFSEIGNGQIGLWNALDVPPLDPFSFAWFLLNLVEAAVTRVLVIDERILSYSDTKDNLQALWSSGVFPVRYVKGNVEHEILPEPPQTTSSAVTPMGVAFDRSLEDQQPQREWDMLIIHESIAEKLAHRCAFQSWATAVQSWTTWIVNTSGRGEGRSELFGKVVPFVGFAAVAQSAYLDRNKLDFVSALIGAELHE